MQCVESVSFSVLINGSPRGMIVPERGIRQGDPLSPYLFILCSEVLSHLLTSAVGSNRLKGMKISATGPTINHLLFADDALFFCHAHQKSCSTIMRILQEYEYVSGQAVNLNKSAITFGSRVQQHAKTRLRRILNINNDGGCGKYLGLPEHIGRKKKEIFNYVVEKVKQRTQSPGYKSSFIWKSLLEGRDLLRKGMRYLIGNGRSTNAWLDPWLPTHPPRPPRCIEGVETNVGCVSDLMKVGQPGWNMELLQNIVMEEDIQLINSIRLSPLEAQDMLGWHYNDSGIYTVKSGYWLASHLPEYQEEIHPPPGSQMMKDAIWKMKTAPKLQHFLWRMLSKALATKVELARRGVATDMICKRCQREEETTDHLFFDCDHSQDIWRGNQYLRQLMCNPTNSFTTKMNGIIECYNNKDLPQLDRQIPLWTLWRIWKSRNQLLYQGLDSTWQMDTIKAIDEAREWVTCWQEDSIHSNAQARIRNTVRRSQWDRPRDNFIKCNYDCKFVQNGNVSQAGWIVRDSAGFFIRAGISRGLHVSSVLEAELQSLVMAMQHTWAQGNRRVIFEGDNNTVQKLVTGKDCNFRVHNWIREIHFWKAKFEATEFQWTRRDNNHAADRLAKEPMGDHTNFVSYFYVPSFLVNILHEDHS
ncbi:Ribonuclease H domain [Arabidopsis thaliana x Arabidopsis arenosa]|uniref:Ribonuclease H domain n=1 Tax=Arabidopsis thaliana x Arabidopsis arenosa TaxID=1240361 RepID=A0A8T2BFG2_9BRAS|nr:Ribonuclease H domain [Arabidopsis thaliana x Arabidopsis arenosa]